MDKATIEAEIAHMEAQRIAALDTAKQAEGAIGALRWVLAKLEDKPSFIQQLTDAVNRGEIYPIGDTETDVADEA